MRGNWKKRARLINLDLFETDVYQFSWVVLFGPIRNPHLMATVPLAALSLLISDSRTLLLVFFFLNSCIIKAFNNFIFYFIYFDLKPLIFFSFNVGVVVLIFFLHCVLFILNNPCFNVMLMLWFSPPLQLYFWKLNIYTIYIYSLKNIYIYIYIVLVIHVVL